MLRAAQVNCGCFMEFWTGGYFKAANHRVAAPPDDQRNHTRCGVFYFAVPNDDEKVRIAFPLQALFIVSLMPTSQTLYWKSHQSCEKQMSQEHLKVMRKQSHQSCTLKRGSPMLASRRFTRRIGEMGREWWRLSVGPSFIILGNTADRCSGY